MWEEFIFTVKRNRFKVGFLRDIFTAPISWLYGMGVSVRHSLYDMGAYKSEEFDIPIVCVGNITVGGTGKTPMTEYLVQLLSSYYNVAVLSRGYKRKTRGFLLAEVGMSYRRIGDEPKQIKLKFPTIPVAVCEKRSVGIKKLRELHPEVNLIILDDGFQHRAVEPWVNIVLMDYNNPIYTDHLLPLGRLRDTKSSLRRAHMVVVTKCPENLTPINRRLVYKNLELFPYQSLYFTRHKSSELLPLFPSLSGEEAKPHKSPVIAIATIANPTGYLEYIESKYQLVDQFIFPDHYNFKMSDIAKIEEAISKAPEGTVIAMTEKDAVKLLASKKISKQTRALMYCISINVSFADGAEDHFMRILSQYVSENQKYKITHPE